MRTYCKSFVTVAIVALLFGTTSTALAHHSFATFDLSRTVTLSGTVKEFQFTNPHIWVQLLVDDPASGKTIEYGLEGASPISLLRAGWKRDSIKPGDKAVIVIHPLRSGEAGGSLVRVEINGAVVGNP